MYRIYSLIIFGALLTGCGELLPPPEDFPSDLPKSEIQALEEIRKNSGYDYRTTNGDSSWYSIEESHITSLILPALNLRSVPSRINDFSKLKVLSLERNGITQIDPELSLVDNLTHLNLSQNKISEIPQHMGNLAQLKVLNLESNEINDLPANFSSLSLLDSFFLSRNQFETLPTVLSKISGLQLLDVSYNPLGSKTNTLPPNTSLKSLILDSCGLTDLGTSLSLMTNLYTLSLKHNQLSGKNTSFPSKLKWLDLSHNPLDPKGEVLFPTSLSKLIIDSTTFESIPPSILELVNLDTLSIGHTKINQIPRDIENLKQLKYLNTNSSNIDVIPDFIFYLPNFENIYTGKTPLKYFNGKHKGHIQGSLFGEASCPVPVSYATSWQLKEMPDCFTDDIDIAENLRDILGIESPIYFETIVSSTNILYTLDISSTNIKSIPEGMFFPINIDFFNSSNNSLVKFPIQINSLKRVTHLDFSKNQLDSLNLTELNLSSLTHLNVANNVIEKISMEKTGVPRLSYLNLENNQINTLSNKLFLSTLDTLILDGNPLTELPIFPTDSSQPKLTVISLDSTQQCSLNPLPNWALQALGSDTVSFCY